jgi:hypothetical protein
VDVVIGVAVETFETANVFAGKAESYPFYQLQVSGGFFGRQKALVAVLLHRGFVVDRL